VDVCNGPKLDLVLDALFARLVVRSFALPAGYQKQQGPTMARTLLRGVFEQTKALGLLVRSDVEARGKSGVLWQMDFQYVADDVHLIQTATVGLREDLRRQEHAFRAFAALVDTAATPGIKGVLAADEPAESNEVSGQLRRMALAHGFEYFAGRREFLELASRVAVSARPQGESHPAGAQELCRSRQVVVNRIWAACLLGHRYKWPRRRGLSSGSTPLWFGRCYSFRRSATIGMSQPLAPFQLFVPPKSSAGPKIVNRSSRG
jgi:hypothetical protein